MQNLTDGILWPENLDLGDYQSYNYIGFMDILASRYGNKILPKIAVKDSEFDKQV